jgi:aldose 1-epimerase
VEAFTLRNAAGTSLRILSYGGIISSLRTADREGRFDDIVLGFDALEDYLPNPAYLGAIVGRSANRIAGGRFAIDGHPCRLSVNAGVHSLHGGVRGFDQMLWAATPFEHDHAAGVTLAGVSPDGDMGYPGRLEAMVTCTLTDLDELAFEYSATTDRPTPVNLSQHSYFNLAGPDAGGIESHRLEIRASRFTPVDEGLIPTGQLVSVAGTPFDFRSSEAIGARIDAADRQLAFAGGYDHNFVLDDQPAEPGPAARVVEPTRGRTLEVHTDQPGIQFYSGNFLDGSMRGRDGRSYRHRAGFCLETQHFPDAPNHPQFPSTILRPGERYATRTVLRFGITGS